MEREGNLHVIIYNVLAFLHIIFHLILIISLEAGLHEECMMNVCSTNGSVIIMKYVL